MIDRYYPTVDEMGMPYMIKNTGGVFVKWSEYLLLLEKLEHVNDVAKELEQNYLKAIGEA